jgi:GMP synthase-like glutamine amidotransferase
MDKAHLVVIDPGVKTPEIEEFNRIVSLSMLPATYHMPGLFGLGSLKIENPRNIRGIVILGSGSSVHDQLPWQIELGSFLKPLMLKGIPTLGLCFGHQLMAHLFGGEVGYAFADQRKETGLRLVDLEACRLWGKERSGMLVVSHREAVVKIPEDFKPLGKSTFVQYEAMEHKYLPLWGFQSHPEAEVDFFAEQGIPLKREDLAFGHELVRCFLASLSPN